MVYLKEDLKNAYVTYAKEIALTISNSLLDFAKKNPGRTEYDETIYIHRQIADEILIALQDKFADSEVTMSFQADLDPHYEIPTLHGMAKFVINWSD